jgi:hypothetical protein
MILIRLSVALLVALVTASVGANDSTMSISVTLQGRANRAQASGSNNRGDRWCDRRSVRILWLVRETQLDANSF